MRCLLLISLAIKCACATFYAICMSAVAGCSLLTLTNGRNSASRGTSEAEDEYTMAAEESFNYFIV